MSAPKLTGPRCQCPACGLLFTSVREFDRHRIGTYAKPGQWRGTRRCFRLAELEARGWQEDVRGFLSRPRLERAPAALQGHISRHAYRGRA
jgi:hypothetical protein